MYHFREGSLSTGLINTIPPSRFDELRAGATPTIREVARIGTLLPRPLAALIQRRQKEQAA